MDIIIDETEVNGDELVATLYRCLMDFSVAWKVLGLLTDKERERLLVRVSKKTEGWLEPDERAYIYGRLAGMQKDGQPGLLQDFYRLIALIALMHPDAFKDLQIEKIETPIN
ncbi:hypothetical protein MUN46_011485 [Mesosutterella sp. AGMB02718]|uniref:Chorismate mutase n=1 Tax=Mesosutterella faecium TaxID=2925194 RepID=A0ABT7IPL0_9BURK|nr:hypothetical protein [Mesosutterella sp. AGMB02718]MDL2060335.1 hypothetical protein [Mesosutterella sp. AGMB02718]MDL2060558.1 hypothetical protein [Mesosutterella sp. AGMB02718]